MAVKLVEGYFFGGLCTHLKGISFACLESDGPTGHKQFRASQSRLFVELYTDSIQNKAYDLKCDEQGLFGLWTVMGQC